MSASTTSARLLADGSLETRQFQNGTETIRTVSVVSADGMTLSDTVTNFGAGASPKPAVFVFVKQ
jgi:hypothetical protein